LRWRLNDVYATKNPRADEQKGIPRLANLFPAGFPTDDYAASVAARGERKKNLKISEKFNARGTTRKETPVVAAANQKMDALVKSNEPIQREKLKIVRREWRRSG
jgi:hypothetical protein